ncbi:MAG: response regulator transcription factor [Paludibacteraceae bacterium]|nr:response regulator transcription factor [Paludibacteraceae bacterium]
METRNILLCEADRNLSMVVSEFLQSHACIVDCAYDGEEGLNKALHNAYDLCLVDVQLPQKNGLTLVRELRESGKEMPVIMVSDFGEKEDILEGYAAGCDDYLGKPYSMDVILCKINAMLRRMQVIEENRETRFRLGTLTFDSERQYIGAVRLSGRENDLLLMLCRKNGHLVERSHILKALWKKDDYFSSRSLSVYINHLRKHLSADPNVKILAVHSKGYKLVCY